MKNLKIIQLQNIDSTRLLNILDKTVCIKPKVKKPTKIYPDIKNYIKDSIKYINSNDLASRIITVHLPRQTGKTTSILSLLKEPEFQRSCIVHNYAIGYAKKYFNDYCAFNSKNKSFNNGGYGTGLDLTFDYVVLDEIENINPAIEDIIKYTHKNTIFIDIKTPHALENTSTLKYPYPSADLLKKPCIKLSNGVYVYTKKPSEFKFKSRLLALNKTIAMPDIVGDIITVFANAVDTIQKTDDNGKIVYSTTDLQLIDRILKSLPWRDFKVIQDFISLYI